MVKNKLLKYLSLIATLISLGLFLDNGKVNAAPTELLYLSPSQKVVEFDETSSSIIENITITNGYDYEISVEIEPTLLLIKDNKLSIIDENEGLIGNIEIQTNTASIAPKESVEIGITIANPKEFVDSLQPGVSVTLKDNNATNDNLSIGPALISTFILENSGGNVAMDAQIEIIGRNIFTKSVTIKGTITNTGERIFDPSGTITLRKSGTRLKEVEITTQINKDLLPGQSIMFEKTITIDNLNLFEIMGKYDIETTITPNPYSTFSTDTKSILIIPVLIFLLGLTILILTIAIIGYTILLISKRK